jgi:hypothetical protein
MKVNERSSNTEISTGHDVAALRLGGRVVLLAELHDVDAVLAEGRADGRRGRGGAGLDLELDDAGELLLGRHVCFLEVIGAELELRDLVEGQLDRRLAAEDRHQAP